MKRFLLVDDNVLFREALALLIEWRTGLKHVQAGSLVEVQWVLGNSPATAVDLAIVDVDLGAEDGLELIETLRETEPHMPILALTTTRDPDQCARALRAGADEVFGVREPDGIEELTHTVTQLAGDAPELLWSRLSGS